MDDRIEKLLLRDFDGAPVDDPEDVVYAAFDDPRYLERLPALRELLADESADAESRLLACFALTSWADGAGYDAVIDAARKQDQAIWFGIWIDRRYSVDTTFTELAGAVAESKDLAADPETERRRVDALRALLQIADTQFFDWQLGAALSPEIVPVLDAEVFAAVQRGLDRLSGSRRLPFPLSFQVADFVVCAGSGDEPRAVSQAQNLLAVDSSPPVLRRLTGLVRHGRQPVTAELAESILTVGGDEVRADVAAALDQRNSRASHAEEVTYYAKVDENRPRTDPRGLVRRRFVDNVVYDEAFTRNLSWEPTEYLRLYALGHNEVEHVEITAQEADDFVQRMTRTLGR